MARFAHSPQHRRACARRIVACACALVLALPLYALACPAQAAAAAKITVSDLAAYKEAADAATARKATGSVGFFRYERELHPDDRGAARAVYVAETYVGSARLDTAGGAGSLDMLERSLSYISELNDWLVESDGTSTVEGGFRVNNRLMACAQACAAAGVVYGWTLSDTGERLDTVTKNGYINYNAPQGNLSTFREWCRNSALGEGMKGVRRSYVAAGLSTATTDAAGNSRFYIVCGNSIEGEADYDLDAYRAELAAYRRGLDADIAAYPRALATFEAQQRATKPSAKKTVAGKRKLTFSWAKPAEGMDGSELRYASKSSMKGAKVKRVAGRKTSLTVKKLKRGKRYYFQVRTYKTVNGVKYFTAWSKKRQSAKVR